MQEICQPHQRRQDGHFLRERFAGDCADAESSTPLNVLWVIVFPLFLLLASAIVPFKGGESLTIGAIRSLDKL